MNKKILSLAVLAAVAIGAQADVTKTGTTPSGFIIPTSPFVGAPGTQVVGALTYTVLVNDLYPADIPVGFTFSGVQYTVTVGSYANYVIVGPGTGYVVNFGLSQTAGETFAVGPNSATHQDFVAPLPSQAGPFTAPTSGTTGQQVVAKGPVVDVTTGYFDAGGTLKRTFTITTKTVSGITGPATNETQPDVFQGATVSVTYLLTQTGVPEAGTYAAGAMLLAGVGFVARRRMIA